MAFHRNAEGFLSPDSTIADRYAFVRSHAGLSKKDFAESLGIHPVVSGDIELGKRDPSRDVLVRLAKIYGVDINWLLTGNPAARNFGAGEEISTASVRLLDQQVAAGYGIEVEDNAASTEIAVPEFLIAPRRPENIRALTTRGDSMTGIGLFDGDVVLFAPKEKEGDGVFVISIENRLLVKRIQFDHAGHCVKIISENPRYETFSVSGEGLLSFNVGGRVIGWLHRC